MRARLCWRIIRTGTSGKEGWRPLEEAEMYLQRRLASDDKGKVENWIEHEKVQR